jgi:hypothetical protein
MVCIAMVEDGETVQEEVVGEVVAEEEEDHKR